MERQGLGKGVKVAVFCVALVAAFAWAFFAMTGCSGSEQVIRSGVAEQLDHYKNADDTAMEEAEKAIPTYQAEKMGIDSDELAHSLLEGFDYTIDSVTVDGDDAECVVTVTCKSMAGLQDEINRLTEEAKADPSIVGGTSLDEIYRWMGSKLMEYVNDAPVDTREPIVLEFTKVGSTWQPTASAQRAMSNLFLG